MSRIDNQKVIHAPFKLIFLKNSQTKHYISNLNLDNESNTDTISKLNKSKITQINSPNLMHLSARIQDQNNITKNNNDLNIQKIINNIQRSIDHVQIQTPLSKNTIYIRKKLHKIQQETFYPLKINTKQKNTVNNLLGQIDFSLAKKNRSKISHRLKENFKSLSLRQKAMRKHTDGDVKQARLKNKIDLSIDFNNFLIKQQQKKGNDNNKKEQIHQQNLLKKLSINNPQDPIKKQKQTQFLGLYRFLSSKSQYKHSTLDNPSQPINKSKISQSSKRQKRIDQILSFYKQKRQQFEWSKIKDNKKRQYILSTIEK